MSTCNQKIVKVGPNWETEPITVRTSDFLAQIKLKSSGKLNLAVSGNGEFFEEDLSFDCNPDPTEIAHCSDHIAGSLIKFYSDVEIESIGINWNILF